ncbi:zinc finger protein 541-like isoform X3 [Scyliorhinus canicula]|uniref:zinc finger protein 541-like isoform X3 n=1 Tax=Scyliorhinus canicula TaxID=7830 RepID=UPI0018F76C72|nr:zinc finger protein 541-like isoform X3 [Scyliorhinus canicula]
MDCYSFTDESSLQTEMHLPLLSDSELPIASNIQRQEFISDPDDIIYAGMTSIELDSNLEAAEIPGDPFADNVDLSLYTVDKGCDSPKIPSDSTDTDSPPMLLGISPLPQKSTPEKGASKSEGKYGGLQKRRRLSARHSPQQAFQECSQCGKSFSSASALSKHYLTHSHERRHVCRICNKAFKRQDHLSGHLLTHQKNKPYVCMEHGCDKSYCDSRSLRRHYEVQHGLYCQREPFADSSSKDVDSTESMLYLQSGHTQTLQCEVGMAQRPTPQVESLSQRSTLPNRELLRPLTSSLSQKMPCDTRASGSKITLHYPTQTHATASVLTSPSICLSERSGTVRQSKYSIMQREHSSSLNCNMSDPYNRVNSSHFSVADPTVSCVESLDSYVVDSVIPGRPSQPAQYALESSRPASWPQAVSTNHTLSRNETVSARQQPSQDLVWTNNLATYSGSKGSYSYIVPNSQPPEEVSATFSSGALHKLDSFAQAFTRQNLDIQSNSSTAKSQGENSAVSEFDACGNVFRQLLSYKANLNQWQTFPEQKHQILQEQYSLQHQQQIATSLFTQVYMGEQEASPVQNQDQFQNHMLQLISDTQYNLSQSQNSGEDIYSLSSMPQEGDASSAVLCRDLVSSSTSQNLDENEENFRCERCQGVFHFLKGLNCHTCPREGMGKQHSLEDGVKSQKVTDNGIEKMEHGGLFFQYLEDKLSALLLKKPLEESVAMPLVIPVSVPVKSAGSKKDGKPVKSENSPVTPRKSVTTRLTDLIVSSNDSSAQVTETGKQANVNCRGHSKKQRRKRSRPEPLFIPSPASNQTGVLPGMVLYQSHMRSPVCLADHLLEKNFQPPPYTPPPMLSPIRHGSGLYFNRICSLPGSKVPHTTYTPKGILGSVVDGVDGIYGISVVKDDSIITIEPHINIGTRFQAEIPLLQDKSLVDDRVHQADLVWKPWDDIETNKVTQARVTDLLNLACSSVLPGGGTNLELALHCLHDTRGDILAALEVLLMKGVRRDPCHPLGDYHYTGTEKWTTAEKKMFNKAICLHNKDFFLMQKMIKYKTVAQCVEYYYTWKKQLKFEWKRTHLLEEEEIKRETDSPADGKEIKKLSFIASQGLSIPSQTSVSREKLKKKIVRSKPSPSPSVHCQTGAQDKNEKKFILGNFPCKECTKVFDKVKSRNAHMKCHRQQEEQERQAEMKRSRIRLKVEPKEEPEETILVFTSNNLSNITTP